MILAEMLRLGEDELMCDLAETYHIYDYRTFRPSVIARLAVGLRDDSRIKMKIAGAKVDMKTSLLAMIADRLQILIWQKTEDGQKGRNVPESILENIYQDHSKDAVKFDSAEDFETERKRILGL